MHVLAILIFFPINQKVNRNSTYPKWKAPQRIQITVLHLRVKVNLSTNSGASL